MRPPRIEQSRSLHIGSLGRECHFGRGWFVAAIDRLGPAAAVVDAADEGVGVEQQLVGQGSILARESFEDVGRQRFVEVVGDEDLAFPAPGPAALRGRRAG
jgi:hypothetical protein